MASKINTHGDGSLTMSSEDYLESIYHLDVESGNMGVHSVDVAKDLGVSKASVNKALSTLREHGMIEQSRYGSIMLTEKGRDYGRDVWHRHRSLRAFLIELLGVDPETAEEEACLIEHDISASTADKWIVYLEKQGISIER
jgi:Mn-dependent DtxR family transcriptional regulator